MLKYPSCTCYVLSSNAGRFNLIYSDNNAVFTPSFNIDESKESEVTENFSLLKSVQDAFAPPLRKGQHRVKGTKGI